MSVIERDIDTMKEELKQRFVTTAQINYGRELSDLSEHELYETLAQVVKQYTSENWIKTNKQYQENDEKQVYYFSIEFLLGRLLNTNLINLDLKNALKAMLQDLDLDIHDLYEEEPDAGLGNGGLGRLAIIGQACIIGEILICLSIPKTQSINSAILVANNRHIIRHCSYLGVIIVNSSGGTIIVNMHISLAAKANLYSLIRLTELPGKAIAQPVIWNLNLLAINNLLLEEAIRLLSSCIQMIALLRASAFVWFRSTSLYLLVYRALYAISCVPMMMLPPLQTRYASRLTIPIQQ